MNMKACELNFNCNVKKNEELNFATTIRMVNFHNYKTNRYAIFKTVYYLLHFMFLFRF